MEEVKKPRSISKPSADIKIILNRKVADYQKNDVPMNVIADYISKGIDEIDLKVTQLENYKKMIEDEIKGIKAHKEVVRIESAEWFNENGFEKLEGIEVSSITLTKPTEAKSEPVTLKKFTTLLSTKEIQDFLVTQNYGKYETTESIKLTPASPQLVKINKRKVKK